MAEKYFVQYWDMDKPMDLQEDVFPTFEEARDFYNELLDNNENWDACIIGDDAREFLSEED